MVLHHGITFPGFSFQPSEFMKVVMIICMSKTVSLHNEKYLIHTFDTDLQLIGRSSYFSTTNDSNLFTK